MPVTLGTNDFYGVPFPLVLADRFFHIYSDKDAFNLDVFRWDEQRQQPVYEVLRGEPQMANISTNPTGIITFAHPNTATFLYKFRPKPGVSQIFGKVPVDKEIEVRISDREITVMHGEKQVGSLQRNQFSGMPIGIQLGADGSMAIGVSALPAGMRLRRSST
jgi:hypothetical protein